MKNLIRKILLQENVGISFAVRNWAKVIYELLSNLPISEKRLIVNSEEYPELFEDFSFDYAVIDFNDWSNGYLTKTSGYDSNGYYVVHIMVLNKFRNNPYMLTILNHELKHAYQDWQRQSKGYPSIDQNRENINIYTEDFIKVLKNRIKINPIFKEVLKGYYILSDLELNAFLENVYDGDKLSPYKKMVFDLINYDAVRATYYENPGILQKDWETLLSLNIPFLKKYKKYEDFLVASTKYFNNRSQEILRKINKMEYVHRDKGLNEQLLGEQIACHLISPKGDGNGGYIDNQKALEIVKKIESDTKSYQRLSDKEKEMFRSTIKNFKNDILRADTNLDTIDTYLHKLANLFKCYPL
jgi:hypothetical protein